MNTSTLKRKGRGSRREYKFFGATLFRNPAIFYGTIPQVLSSEFGTGIGYPYGTKPCVLASLRPTKSKTMVGR